MRMVVLILPCMQGLFAHEVILSFTVKQGGFYEKFLHFSLTIHPMMDAMLYYSQCPSMYYFTCILVSVWYLCWIGILHNPVKWKTRYRKDRMHVYS